MSERTFKLEVVTPDRVVYSNDHVVSIIAPGVEGYLGALANRAPLVTQLDIGEIDFRKADGDWDYISVCGGFMEVFENRVTILAESAELCEEIDVERAERARDRALERIASHSPDIDIDRAQAALKRALTRLHVASRRG
ncbi:MAG: F0F1 ATP synthase subunit epsilon [Armatimonadetes bacterium]|nr:F0F1 ATP synthase subunit epsilon [Armatimonadota bacterium]